MQYNDSYNELLLSFANNIHTIDGGTHEKGFKNALTRVFNDYGRRHNILKDADKNLSGDDVREGLTCVISVKLQEAQFEGQTKGKLGNTEMRGIVENMVYSKLLDFFEENPGIAKTILEKALGAERAREEARKARDLTRPQIPPLETASLPGKLADCTEKGSEVQKYISSRETRPAARLRTGATAAIRRYFPFGEKCSTSKRQDSTRFTETKSLCLL